MGEQDWNTEVPKQDKVRWSDILVVGKNKPLSFEPMLLLLAPRRKTE
jgi:hypothetical protein